MGSMTLDIHEKLPEATRQDTRGKFKTTKSLFQKTDNNFFRRSSKRCRGFTTTNSSKNPSPKTINAHGEYSAEVEIAIP